MCPTHGLGDRSTRYERGMYTLKIQGDLILRGLLSLPRIKKRKESRAFFHENYLDGSIYLLLGSGTLQTPTTGGTPNQKQESHRDVPIHPGTATRGRLNLSGRTSLHCSSGPDSTSLDPNQDQDGDWTTHWHLHKGRRYRLSLP